ncbi:MAG: hypothetical protein WC343_07890 [Bacilli bacterium]|jgi:hypothetical protein
MNIIRKLIAYLFAGAATVGLIWVSIISLDYIIRAFPDMHILAEVVLAIMLLTGFGAVVCQTIDR